MFLREVLGKDRIRKNRPCLTEHPPFAKLRVRLIVSHGKGTEISDTSPSRLPLFLSPSHRVQQGE